MTLANEYLDELNTLYRKNFANLRAEIDDFKSDLEEWMTMIESMMDEQARNTSRLQSHIARLTKQLDILASNFQSSNEELTLHLHQSARRRLYEFFLLISLIVLTQLAFICVTNKRS